MASLKEQFRVVFALSEIPEDGDVDVVTHWLLNHNGKPPSRRCLAAIRCVESRYGWALILNHYTIHIRKEIVELDISDVTQLARTKEYFLSPMQYIYLTPHEFSLVERTLNSVIKSKITAITSLTPTEEEFITSIGVDTEELSKLKYQRKLESLISSFAGVWDRSFLTYIDNNEVSKLALSKLRIKELFDIVIGYPKSRPALQDLKRCLRPSQRNDLVQSFTENCIDRILHAGANTNDIILCFIFTIKSFLIIDPVGVLLDTAYRPIKRYLHEREDTIPVVIDALINPDPKSQLSQLAEELAKEPEKTVNTLTLDWSPAPIDALPDFRKQDIIESLISLNDKKLFIEELESVIAQRLLTLKSFDIAEMLTKVVQLKSRFAENELSKLDVMIKDIVESETVNRIIHEKNSGISSQLQFSILSHAYWPEFEEERFNPPDELQKHITLYEEGFKAVKDGRVMAWVNSGIVEIDLEFKNTTLSFSVTPINAALISCFNDQESLTLAQIMKELSINHQMAEDSIEFWKRAGVLKEKNHRFHVTDDPLISRTEENGTRAAVIKLADHSLDYCRTFITAMLTNLGPMELAKIHKFLNAVIPKEKNFTASEEELCEFLNCCVEDGKLECISNEYQIKN
jgi:anaphase-promoting complex subunit 2